MAETSSGSIQISGLGNGTDFQKMIDDLEKIEMNRAVQLNQWKTDWNTRLDAFKQVQGAMVEYSAALKKLNNVDKFMVKNVLNSNTGVCAATATGSADNTSHSIVVQQRATNSYSSISLDLTSKLDSINNTGATQQFEFTVGGVAKTLNVPPKCTLEGLKNLINQEFGSPNGNALGVRATVIDGGNGKQLIQLYSTRTGDDTAIRVTNDALFRTATVPGQEPLQNPTLNWLDSDGKDALVRVDGWPAPVTNNPLYPDPNDNPDSWLKQSKNTLTHIPGLSINITGVGVSVVDIDLDTDAVKENIHAFVDSTNTLRTLLKEYSDYNTNKQVVDSDYANSQFETQKGGVLQGNYGMQLMMSKMKTLVMSKPNGFEYLQKDSDGNVVSGDTFASLAQIGIKTDADQGSPTHGLLVFEDNLAVLTSGKVEMITFDDALRMNAQNIAELFAADCAPSVDGQNFGYSSHLSGFTRPGDYDVKYKVDNQGNIYDAWINGKQAHWYPNTNQLTLRGQDGSSNAADGIIIDIYNNSETAAGQDHTGAIRLKSGFLPSLVTMLDRDFLDPDSGASDKEKGTLSVLITQYQKIIDGINTKIAREDERIIKWRRFTEQRFANLEANLKTYGLLQTQLESQVKSLSSNK